MSAPASILFARSFLARLFNPLIPWKNVQTKDMASAVSRKISLPPFRPQRIHGYRSDLLSPIDVESYLNLRSGRRKVSTTLACFLGHPRPLHPPTAKSSTF